MVTKVIAERNLKEAKKRLSDKQNQILKLKKKSIFRGVRIQDQFSVGRSGIRAFREQSKLSRKSTLRQLGISNSELPMLRDELNLRRSELESISPSLGNLM